jgi:repressor LexA
MYPTLTRKQKDILEYIRVYNQLHGYSPSLEEIKNHFRLSAISTVHEHIQNLKRKGYIYNEINQARSIRPLDPKIENKEIVEIPLVYKLTKTENLELLKTQKTIQLHKQFLLKDGTYIAILIESELYKDFGILNEDILIIKETADIKRSGIVIVNSKNNKAALMKVNSSSKLEPLLNEHLLSKSTCIKGILCDLIRKYI